MDPSDRELVLAAQAGDARSLASLLARHRAAMHAVAISVMGAGPDVEDVVQDASVVALTDIGRIRDPERVRAWLTGTTRNLVRARLRRRDPLPWVLEDLPSAEDLERRIDETALRDWVWQGVNGLSEPLHAVVVLRYFSTIKSYDAIAAALGIPVGTVRSRLHEARASLLIRLSGLEGAAADDHTRVTQAREQLFAAIVQEYNSGNGPTLLAGALVEGARLTVAASDEVYVGPAAIARSLTQDIEVGVRLRLLRVVAGAGLTVVEGAFHNPAEAPGHCPPFTSQVYRHHGEGIAGVHLAYSSG